MHVTDHVRHHHHVKFVARHWKALCGTFPRLSNAMSLGNRAHAGARINQNDSACRPNDGLRDDRRPSRASPDIQQVAPLPETRPEKLTTTVPAIGPQEAEGT
jgi:hypothetical protein